MNKCELPLAERGAEATIRQMLVEFNFAACRTSMKRMGWSWGWADGAGQEVSGLPSVEQMHEVAEECLRLALLRTVTVRRRGFTARVVRKERQTWLRLVFQVTWVDRLLQEIQRAGLPLPELEYEFARPRQYRFDMAWPAKLLALECDGATWTAGSHARGQGIETDAEKYSMAAIRGWRVMRVTSGMIKRGQAIQFIRQGLGLEELL